MSDDERREVAERLRGLEVPSRVERMEHPESTAAWYELLCGAVGGKKDPWAGIKALANRLADLIDPDCEEGRYSVARTVRPVDRGALLGLTDEIVESYVTSGSDGDELVMSRGAALFVARRIREACGEVDA